MKALNTIFSAVLALVVLLSSFSLTIDKHLCMGRVQSVAILHEAAPCPMEMMAESGMGAMDGCCQDTQTKIEGNEYHYKAVKEIGIEYQSLWVATLPQIIETLDLTTASTFEGHTLYKPPLIERDVPVLIQSFLI
ncbi:MAG: hypothetical protein RIB47_15790 [Cyclobacteriaceae bacterium]